MQDGANIVYTFEVIKDLDNAYNNTCAIGNLQNPSSNKLIRSFPMKPPLSIAFVCHYGAICLSLACQFWRWTCNCLKNKLRMGINLNGMVLHMFVMGNLGKVEYEYCDKN